MMGGKMMRKHAAFHSHNPLHSAKHVWNLESGVWSFAPKAALSAERGI
jgi:hypothetical protein